MSEYPVNSTAKEYFDCDGEPTTLHRLVRAEPDWAYSRIKEGEKASAQRYELLEALKVALNDMIENLIVLLDASEVPNISREKILEKSIPNSPIGKLRDLIAKCESK